jgi:hypothetical protein
MAVRGSAPGASCGLGIVIIKLTTGVVDLTAIPISGISCESNVGAPLVTAT